jgi:hypothetical protein
MEDKDRDTLRSIQFALFIINMLVLLFGCYTCNKQYEIKRQLNNIEYKLNK